MSRQYQIDERKRLSIVLKNKREDKKLTIKELAKLARVSVSTVYALENAKRNATVRTLVRLDNILSS